VDTKNDETDWEMASAEGPLEDRKPAPSLFTFAKSKQGGRRSSIAQQRGQHNINGKNDDKIVSYLDYEHEHNK
jgi:hypothetical protein